MMLLSIFATEGNAGALAAPAGMQRPLIPLTAKFDESNVIKGGVQVRASRTVLQAGSARRGRTGLRAGTAHRGRTALRAGTARRGHYHLTARVTHSPRRLIAKASANTKRQGLQSGNLAVPVRPILLSAASGKPDADKGELVKLSTTKLATDDTVTTTLPVVEREPCTCHEASALYKSKQYDKAINAYGAYAEKILKTFKTENADYANALMWQGYIMQEVGRKDEAKAKYAKAAEVYKKGAGSDHKSDIEWIANRLAEL